jgi:hypothetical protein
VSWWQKIRKICGKKSLFSWLMKKAFFLLYNAVFSASTGEIRFTRHEIRIMLALKAKSAENTKAG